MANATWNFVYPDEWLFGMLMMRPKNLFGEGSNRTSGVEWFYSPNPLEIAEEVNKFAQNYWSNKLFNQKSCEAAYKVAFLSFKKSLNELDVNLDEQFQKKG